MNREIRLSYVIEITVLSFIRVYFQDYKWIPSNCSRLFFFVWLWSSQYFSIPIRAKVVWINMLWNLLSTWKILGGWFLGLKGMKLHVQAVSLVPSARMTSWRSFVNFMRGFLNTFLNKIYVCLFLGRKGDESLAFQVH